MTCWQRCGGGAFLLSQLGGQGANKLYQCGEGGIGDGCEGAEKLILVGNAIRGAAENGIQILPAGLLDIRTSDAGTEPDLIHLEHSADVG